VSSIKIKICGLFQEQDIDFVNEARPDYAGFVFAPSRRQISPQTAAAFRARLNSGIVPVGVFVNAPAAEINALYRNGIIAAAQLHGGESAAFMRELKSLCGIPIIQAIKSRTLESGTVCGADSGANRAGICVPEADFVLFDGDIPGTGKVFDWNLLARTETEKPWFLAGGINEQTIDKALALRPFGIDVSSGAESGGVKDRKKIIHLTAKVRAALVSE
jgi:phosphoribosylanthranilate isomerase